MKRTFSAGHSTYAIIALCLLLSCVSRDEPKPDACENSDLAIVVSGQTNPTGCTSNDGQIMLMATGGVEPYQFALNNDEWVSSATFTGLSAGIFTMKVSDAKGCEQHVDVTLDIPGTTLAATISAVADSECLTDNGSLSISASGGTAPYQYRIGAGSFGSAAVFNELKNGSYVITVKDESGCSLSLNATVARGNTGIRYSSEVKAIITAKCATSSCHGGNQSPNLTVFNNLVANSANMKSRIQSGSMPPATNTPLTADEKAKIICWIEDGTNNN